MSDLQEFVNQQKAKNTSFPSINTIRSKFASGLNGFALIRQTDDSDREILTESNGQINGQLPQSRNRKIVDGSDVKNAEDCRIFMSIGAAFVCFGIAVILLPTVVIQARKFAALNTLGSIMLILSDM
ncbi:Protein transport protein SFT2 [Dirofilaria immitis]|nr:Protein transport protein SFT2 [Dirofilaria immitis]